MTPQKAIHLHKMSEKDFPIAASNTHIESNKFSYRLSPYNSKFNMCLILVTHIFPGRSIGVQYIYLFLFLGMRMTNILHVIGIVSPRARTYSLSKEIRFNIVYNVCPVLT
jgi:hypothetical protein